MKKIYERTLTYVLSLIFAACTFLCGVIYNDLKPIFLKELLPSVSRESLLALVLLLLLAVTILSAWIVFVYLNRPSLKKYKFNKEKGYLEKNGVHYCTRCLLERKQEVPLIDDSKTQFICIRSDCMTYYEK